MARKSRKFSQLEPLEKKSVTFNTWAYGRISIETDTAEDSIENQIAIAKEFISDKADLVYHGEFTDLGYSGTNFDRPNYEKMLSGIKGGTVQCIVVKDLSRFGRNYLEIGDYLEQLFPSRGIRFISVNDMYDSAQFYGTTGGINIAFRNLMAGLYSQDLSDTVRSAKTSINMRGKTSAPYVFYGYISDPKDRHKLIIDPPAAEIVRMIFNLREQGMTTPKIARKFNDDGVQTANERKKEQGAKRNWLRNGRECMWESGATLQCSFATTFTGIFCARIFYLTAKHEYGIMFINY